jgi:hypothetical protein
MLLAQTAVEDGLAGTRQHESSGQLSMLHPLPGGAECVDECQQARVNSNVFRGAAIEGCLPAARSAETSRTCSNGLFDSGANPIRFGFP